MRARIAIVVAGLLAAGCANTDGGGHVAQPSFLGALAAEPEDYDLANVPEELKRVKSSKVLAAIALEKATGRKADPSRLSGP